MGTLVPTFWVPTHAWEDVEPDGVVDSVSEAVQAWLNSKNLKMSDLTPALLSSLIDFIEDNFPNLKNSDGYKSLIDLQTNWQRDLRSAKTPLEKEAVNDFYQLKFLKSETLDLINPGGANEDLLTEYTSREAGIVAAFNLAKSIGTGTAMWSQYGNQASVQEIKDMLANIKAMRDAGYPVDEMGLGKLESSLTSALADYEKVLANLETMTPKPSKEDAADQRTLALSNLRQSLVKARIEYLKVHGGPGKDALISAEESVLRQEQLWADKLKTPWYQLNQNARLEGLGLKDLKKYQSELEAKLDVARTLGDKVQEGYLKARIAIVKRTITQMEKILPDVGSTPSFASNHIAIVMVRELVDTDIVKAEDMLRRAKAEGNKDLIIKFTELVDRLKDIRAKLLDFEASQGEKYFQTFSQLSTR